MKQTGCSLKGQIGKAVRRVSRVSSEEVTIKTNLGSVIVVEGKARRRVTHAIQIYNVGRRRYWYVYAATPRSKCQIT
jgi:hypothetical protein